MHQQEHALFTANACDFQASCKALQAIRKFAIAEAARIVNEGDFVWSTYIGRHQILREVEWVAWLANSNVFGHLEYSIFIADFLDINLQYL